MAPLAIDPSVYIAGEISLSVFVQAVDAFVTVTTQCRKFEEEGATPVTIAARQVDLLALANVEGNQIDKEEKARRKSVSRPTVSASRGC